MRNSPHQILYPASFFYGAAQNFKCGCGAWLMLTPTCHYKIHWAGGHGTNMRAETLDLWALLWFAQHLYLDSISVYGDSQVLIGHLSKGIQLNQIQLEGWMERIKVLRNKFTSISFIHIYREKNSEAGRFSKMGLSGQYGEMHYELFEANGQGARGTIIIF